MIKRLLILLSLNTIFVAYFAIAQGTAKDKMLVVTEEWPPYNYVEADGKIVGSSTVIVEKVLRRSDIPYTLNVYPWARSYELALNNANVLIYSIIRTPEREKLFHWVCPLYSVEYFVFQIATRKDIVVNSLDDLKKYSIGITRETFLDHFLKSKGFITGTHLQDTGDRQASFRKLLANRVDLIIDTKEFIDEQLTSQKLSADKIRSIYKMHDDIGNPTNICMAISLKTPINLVNKIREEHQKLSLNFR